ncbi:putative RTA1 domain protein [Dactylonectria macrodidyma]|uniref:RTA1 domain protein n=1 Tax=Dactylonectria macrodidyma TaxID=307937 RepID=A0A9P9D002_9HYPO|nr:putative RTA1 domain protein [Dactylonectria macrodidyma]
MASFDTCKDVSPACPVEAKTYGYTPVLWADAALLVVFALGLLLQVVIGFKTRVYSYSFAVACGCALEAAGYGGRLMIHNNPWSSAGFRMQIVCLIIKPLSFVTAGIYLALKHLVRSNRPDLSFIKPELYTWIFVGCDAGSILLQAAGGDIAGAAKTSNKALLDTGNNIIIARHCILGSHHGLLLSFPRYVTVLVRCIYRLPEMSGGWGNPRMRDEKEFLILDGL